MATYRTLFSLEVAHSYFAGGACPGLALQPAEGTRRLMQRGACLLRQTDRGLLMAHDQAGSHALAHLADDGELVFHFLARMPDPNFANYTEGHVGSPESVHLFDNPAPAQTDARGRQELRSRQLPISAPELEGVLSAHDRRVPPHFIVTVSMDADALTEPPRFVCHLQARATVWKYCLFGDMTEQPDELQIVDLAQTHRFDTAVDEQLPDGRAMCALRSTQPIALQDRSTQRFQLRRQGASADKVLIKRLPVASPSQLNRETLGGQPTWVSEIYVQR